MRFPATAISMSRTSVTTTVSMAIITKVSAKSVVIIALPVMVMSLLAFWVIKMR